MKPNYLSIFSFWSLALMLTMTATQGAGLITVSNHQGVGTSMDLDAAKTYLHKLDFPGDGSGDTVNGVTFSAVPGDAGLDPLTGNPYGLFMSFPTEFAGAGLLGDFLYNGGQPAGAAETVTLGGFVPGMFYDVRFYYRSFGPRPQDVTIDTDGTPGAEWSGVLDQDTPSPENYCSIIFQAETPLITIKFTQQVYNAAWHQYGITSELVPNAPNLPISISLQPQNQSVRQGATTAFRVQTTGSTPIAFQWRKDGNPIPNATNMVLVLSNVSQSDAGIYDVTIHNSVSGIITSTAATLAVRQSADFVVSKVAGLTVKGIPGRTAEILRADQFGASNEWTNLFNITLTGNLQMVFDPAVTNLSTRFYRGQVTP